MRNMEKTAERIKGQFEAKNGLDRYDLTFDEITQLIRECEKGNEFEAIEMAFLYGFVLGNRATVAGKVKGKL